MSDTGHFMRFITGTPAAYESFSTKWQDWVLKFEVKKGPNFCESDNASGNITCLAPVSKLCELDLQ
jgi:hypothetical protein